MIAECRWPLAAALGEAPVWCRRSATLWFTDIKRCRLHCFDPATGARSSFDVEDQPGFVLPADDGSMIVGMGQALHRFTDGAVTDRLVTIPMDARNRLNDATVDAKGRLWCGSMDDGGTHATGAVYLYDGASVMTVGGFCPVTNGPAVSPDGTILYHVDTRARTVWRFDIGTGVMLEGGTPFIEIPEGEGCPDGITVDAEGSLWVAIWGGWSVRRYAPDGKLLATVALPCANITKLAFGGSDLRTAYVTSACVGLTQEELDAQPLAGGLFAFRADVPGAPIREFAMGACQWR